MVWGSSIAYSPLTATTHKLDFQLPEKFWRVANMFRRALSLFLVPLLLLQGLGLAHSHGASSAATGAHGQSPHFHWGALVWEYHACHGGHQHDDNDDDDDDDATFDHDDRIDSHD